MTRMKVNAALPGDLPGIRAAGEDTRIPPGKIVTGKGNGRKWIERNGKALI
jgi:hypothetical protein